MKRLRFLVLTTTMSTLAATASAVPLLLEDATRCGAVNATANMAVGDVTGNAGGATECWGTFGPNDPGPSGDGIQISGMQYDFLSKKNTPGALEPDPSPIGLSVDLSMGTWSFTSPVGGDFLVVLNASNQFSVWLFDGSAQESVSGTWEVAFLNNGGQVPALSHLSIYKKVDPGMMPDVPEPATLALIGAGLLALGSLRRRRN